MSGAWRRGACEAHGWSIATKCALSQQTRQVRHCSPEAGTIPQSSGILRAIVRLVQPCIMKTMSLRSLSVLTTKLLRQQASTEQRESGMPQRALHFRLRYDTVSQFGLSPSVRKETSSCRPAWMTRHRFGARQPTNGWAHRCDTRITLSALTSHPDGKTIITGGTDNTARLWDTETHEQIGSSMKHGGTVYDVRFSPTGSFVLTGSGDQTAVVWSVSDGEPIRVPLRQQGRIMHVAVSRDGTTLATRRPQTEPHNCGMPQLEVASARV